MKLMLITIFMLSIAFGQVTHPVALVVTILAQTTACCIFLTSLNTTSWFSFILFLIFLGGLMVLFIYIASLASNEKFSFETKSILIATVSMISMMLFMSFNLNDQSVQLQYCSEPKMLMNMYMMNTGIVTAMTMIYLLLTLVIVVKVTSKYEGPLRNMIYQN